MISRFALGFLAVSLVLLPACSRETNAPPIDKAQLSVGEDVASATVSVVDPEGRSICGHIPDGVTVQIAAVQIGVVGGFASIQRVPCPNNAFTFTVPPGSYLFRARLPEAVAIANRFPWQSWTLSPLEIAGDVSTEISVNQGTPLGGGVTVNGQPVGGTGLTLAHADATGFGVAFGQSSAAGGWEEVIPVRPQMLLQNGVRVNPNVICDLLGTRLLEPVSFAPFEFPREKSGVSCDFVDAPAQQFSHTRTRLIVTPGPGDIGAGQHSLADELGNGWGVQFPVNPGEQPRIDGIWESHLFQGGLVIGMQPDRVLSSNELGGYFPCGPVCRDFGPEGRLHYTSAPSFGKKVTWQYSDANSSEGVGMKVVQKSYDGVPPADYVLFRFTLTNSGSNAQTIYSGFFGDWDIDVDFFDDVGATEQNGRLMYMTNSGGGVAAGTLIVSDVPVSGNAFFNFDFETNNAPTSTAEFVDALAGDFGSPSGDQFGDKWYVHAVGPITLAPGQATEIWIAIAAGDDVEQLRANAAAAQADITVRRNEPDAVDATPATSISTGRGKARQANAITPACKKWCRALQ